MIYVCIINTLEMHCCGGWGYSSVVEHLTADQEVPSSNLGAPLLFIVFAHGFCLMGCLYAQC